MATLADQFDLRPRHIRTAIDFAAPHREVIEEQIAANVRAAKQARELVARRAELSRSVRPAVPRRRAISCHCLPRRDRHPPPPQHNSPRKPNLHSPNTT